jgi:hypothetical protein
MTHDQAIDLLQVMLLDETEPRKIGPASFAATLRPAFLERNVLPRQSAVFCRQPIDVLDRSATFRSRQRLLEVTRAEK